MQHFSNMVSLRAIHILQFKNNDTCIWVMREILKFIVDNLSHNPELELEWIAMEDDRVDRVVRQTQDPADPNKSTKGKQKAKSKEPNFASALAWTSGHWTSVPALPLDGLESESDSEDDDLDSGRHLRLRTVGPVQFYDIYGVDIFQKEVRHGRL